MPPPPFELQMLSVGALAAAGACAATATAAAWTGLSRLTLHPEDAGDDELRRHLARADYLEGDDLARLEALLVGAVRAAVAVVPRAAALRAVPVWLGLPAHRTPLPPDFGWRLEAALTQACAPLAVRVTVERAGGASALVGLAAAARTLERGEADLALVAAVDSLVSEDAMDGLLEAGRLHGTDRAWGLVPGEGAACFLLGGRGADARLGVRSLCRVTGVAVSDVNGRGGGGGALTEAVCRAAAAGAAGASVRHLFCDLNGERLRSDEWAFTMLRGGLSLDPDPDIVTPALSWGDAGTASGGLALAAAVTAARAGWFHGPALVWSVGDGVRAAACLEVPAGRAGGRGAGERIAAPPEPERPESHRVHDRVLLRELLDEAVALAEQRSARLAAENTGALPDWTRLARLESRLDRHLDAFGLGGDEALAMAMEALATGEPPAIYVSTRVFSRTGRAQLAIATFLQAGRLEPPLVQALADGFRHGLAGEVGAEVVKPVVDALAGGPDSLLPAALTLAAHAGVPVPRSLVERASRLGPQVVGEAFPLAIGRAGAASDVVLLTPWLVGSDVGSKTAAAIAWLRRGDVGCDAFLRERRGEPWALVPLALSGTSGSTEALVRPESPPGGQATHATALGILGDLRGLRLLLRMLAAPEGDEGAAAAALALALVTGAHLTETVTEEEVFPDESLFEDELAARRAGDRRVGVARRDITRLCRDPARWEQWLRENQSRFETGRRYRMGLRQGLEADLRALAHPTFPPALRRLLVESLTLRERADLAFDSEAPLAVQRAALVAIERRIHEAEARPVAVRGRPTNDIASARKGAT